VFRRRRREDSGSAPEPPDETYPASDSEEGSADVVLIPLRRIRRLVGLVGRLGLVSRVLAAPSSEHPARSLPPGLPRRGRELVVPLQFRCHRVPAGRPVTAVAAL